jgi:oxygen-dependent protoporphyrinogen oxidase
MEPLAARRMPPLTPDSDVSVGEFVSKRFGAAVSRAYVEPLLGTIHGGDVGRLSLRATSPSLVPAATDRRSLVLRRRPPRTRAPMEMVTWAEGLGTLVRRLVDTADGVEVRCSMPVTRLTRADDGYLLATQDDSFVVDAVVLAVPAAAAAALLRDLAPAAADRLDSEETADVVTVLVGLPRDQVSSELRGSGLLVPPDSGRLLKAATYLTHKWPHLAGHETSWLRLSAGRAGDTRAMQLDDTELVAALMTDLHELTGLSGAPARTVVRRWRAALPQLTVGHPARMEVVRSELPPGVVLAGASYDGVGLASSLRSGADAAAGLVDQAARAS